MTEIKTVRDFINSGSEKFVALSTSNGSFFDQKIEMTFDTLSEFKDPAVAEKKLQCKNNDWTIVSAIALRRYAAEEMLKADKPIDSITVTVDWEMPLGGNNGKFSCYLHGSPVMVYVFFLLESTDILVGGVYASLKEAIMSRSYDRVVDLKHIIWLDDNKTQCFIAGPRRA